MAKKELVDVDFCKNEIQNVKAQNVPSTPSGVEESQFWYDTVDRTMKFYNGESPINMGQQEVYTFVTPGLTETDGEVTLDLATTTTRGGVIVGGNIDVNTGTISVKDADTSNKGVIEIATDSEANTGTSETLAVNPKQLATKIPSTEKGAANGVATLDTNGKIPSSQLPGFVDDIIETYVVSGATALSAGWLSLTDGGSALTPETGKIYVILSTGDYLNRTYRWGGTTYVEVSGTPTRKYVVNNSALTTVGGVCTWAITHNLGDGIIARVYEVTSGDEVGVTVTLTSANVATITLNSTSNIAANTYKAVVIGG